jgi:hypothetical protein
MICTSATRIAAPSASPRDEDGSEVFPSEILAQDINLHLVAPHCGLLLHVDVAAGADRTTRVILVAPEDHEATELEQRCRAHDGANVPIRGEIENAYCYWSKPTLCVALELRLAESGALPVVRYIRSVEFIECVCALGPWPLLLALLLLLLPRPLLPLLPLLELQLWLWLWLWLWQH